MIRPHVELVRAASTLSTCVGHMPINRSMPLEKDSFLDELRLLVCRLPLNRLNDHCGERYVVIIAFVFGAMNNVIYAMASNKTAIYIGVAFGSFVGMSFPTISAIKSNNVVSTSSSGTY